MDPKANALTIRGDIRAREKDKEKDKDIRTFDTNGQILGGRGTLGRKIPDKGKSVTVLRAKKLSLQEQMTAHAMQCAEEDRERLRQVEKEKEGEQDVHGNRVEEVEEEEDDQEEYNDDDDVITSIRDKQSNSNIPLPPKKVLSSSNELLNSNLEPEPNSRHSNLSNIVKKNKNVSQVSENSDTSDHIFSFDGVGKSENMKDNSDSRLGSGSTSDAPFEGGYGGIEELD